MANRLYAKALEKILSGSINFLTDDIRAVLVDGADHNPDTVAHEFLSSIVPAARVAVTANLTGRSVTAGVFRAANTQFTAAAGDQSELIVLYKHTGTDSTSPLIELIDTVSGGSLLSVIPNGGDIAVVWDTGGSGIFAL